MTAGVLEMASKRGPGRPKNGRPKQTESVRVRADLAQIIGLVADAKRQREADMLDPLLRPLLYSEYARLFGTIRAMHAEAVAAAAAVGDEPPPPLPVVMTQDPKTGEEVSLEEMQARMAAAPTAAEPKRRK